MRHPFSGVDPEVVKAALIEMGSKKTEEFPALVKSLLDRLRAKYPPHILAVIAYYGLQAGVSGKGVSDQSLIPAMEQHHIELLQALVLTIPVEEWGVEPATPGDIQQVIDTITELGNAFHQRRYRATETEGDV
jgi:hypothetical protein